MSERKKNILAAVNSRLGALARNAAVVCMFCMTAIVLYQIVLRYGLNNAPSWSESAARAFMLWMVILIAPSAYRWSGFVTIEILRPYLPTSMRNYLGLAINLASLILLAYMLWLAIDFVDRGLNRRAQGLPANILGFPITAAWVRLSMPIGLTMMVLVNLELLLIDLKRIKNPNMALDESRPNYMVID